MMDVKRVVRAVATLAFGVFLWWWIPQQTRPSVIHPVWVRDDNGYCVYKNPPQFRPIDPSCPSDDQRLPGETR